MSSVEWLDSVKHNAVRYLNALYKKDGFFAYSRTADRYGDSMRWGLANAVFAVKTLYIMKMLESFSAEKRQEIIDFIHHFQRKPGLFVDPLVASKTALFNKIVAIRNLNFSNFFGEKTMMAETRQALVALLLLEDPALQPYTQIPYTGHSIERYIRQLHWKDPWGALSHLNHLIFFYVYNAGYCGYRVAEGRLFAETCVKYIDGIQNAQDGLWYTGSASLRQKCNAAMKVLSAFNVAKRQDIPYAEKIIDTILRRNEEPYYNGCDYLNVAYVLRYVYASVNKTYRKHDIEGFCDHALHSYRKFYREAEGGFSFVPDSSPRRYYGMEVSK